MLQLLCTQLTYSSAEIQVIGRDEANETGEAMRLGDLPGELQQAFVRGQC